MASPSLHHFRGGFQGNDTALTDCLLMELTECLHPGDFRPLGLRLGFTETRLSQIEHSRLGVVSECMYVMLTEWKRQVGKNATSQFLIQSVRECRNSEAADWLQSELGPTESAQRTISVEEKLNEGNVPALPDCLTARPAELASMRSKLRRASAAEKSGRWVVVYGMGGMGKTVLANQAVRDEQLIKDCFSDGVFWLSMGSVKDVESILDRLETLCRIFDSNLSSAPSPPKTLEQWKHLLNKLLTQRYPRSLLVLDDVWIPEVVTAFDVRCTVLITTRDIGVTSHTSGHKEEMNLSSGLSEEQCLHALSEWTSMSMDDLPPEAELIYGFSHGSPLAIAIVGALLRDFSDRWRFYAAKMEAKKMQEMSSDLAYEYRSVYEAMEMSMEQLSEKQMDVYSWFAVFAEGTKISCKILAMMAECSKEDVEDRMRVIIQRSLISTDWTEDENCREYWLHDLLHDHLVARGAGKEKPPSICNEFKCLLTLRRFKTCKVDMVQTALQFPPSSTVFQRALRVAQSSRDGFFVTDRTDTRPTMKCHRYGTSSKTPRRAILITNGTEVVSAGFDGLAQIADVESGDVRLSLSAHTETVSDLSVSPDGSLLATCSTDRSLCVWDIMRDSKSPTRKSPERLVKRLTHDNARITRCAFVTVRKDVILVSADETGSVKLWDSSFILQNSWKAHDSAILTLWPDEGQVITTAKNDDTAKVFHLISGELKFQLGHDYDLCGATRLSNGMIATLTWCQLRVFNGSGRRLADWTNPNENEFLADLDSCHCSDGELVIVLGRGGTATVFRMGKTFTVTRKLSTFCRLRFGGVFRGINSIHLTSVKAEQSAKESIFLTTANNGTLISVWMLEKAPVPLTVNSALTDVAFGPSGEIQHLVGQETNDSNKVMLMVPSADRGMFMSSTGFFKVAEKEYILAVDTSQVPGQAGIYTDEGVLSVVKLPKVGRNWGAGSSTTCKNFKPAESKVLLSRFLQGSRELLIVSAGAGISVEIWSTDKQPIVVSSHQVTSHQGLSADLSHDQSKLVIGCSDGTALLYKISDSRLRGEEPTSLQGPASRVSVAQFSSDGKLLLLTGWKHIKVFDMETLQESASSIDERAISIAKFSPDSKGVLTTSSSYMKMRDSRTLHINGTRAISNYGHIKDARFSSDSSIIITSGHVKTFDYGYIEWWKVEKGKISPLQKFRMDNRVPRVLCNAQFTTFVAVDEVGQIFVLERVGIKI